MSCTWLVQGLMEAELSCLELDSAETLPSVGKKNTPRFSLSSPVHYFNTNPYPSVYSEACCFWICIERVLGVLPCSLRHWLMSSMMSGGLTGWEKSPCLNGAHTETRAHESNQFNRNILLRVSLHFLKSNSSSQELLITHNTISSWVSPISLAVTTSQQLLRLFSVLSSNLQHLCDRSFRKQSQIEENVPV